MKWDEAVWNDGDYWPDAEIEPVVADNLESQERFP